jgi:hypothetical protein
MDKNMDKTIMQASVYLGAVLLVVSLPCAAQTPAATACALKASEVSAALGAKFEEGQPGTERTAGAIVMRSCSYKSKEYLLNVNTITYASVADAKYDSKPLAGKVVAVAGDPDGAVNQVGQGDLDSPNVRYVRGTTSVELRILGTFYKDSKNKAADTTTLQAKMLKLKRFP